MEARRQATPLGNSCKYIFVPFVCLAAAAAASARGRKYERRAHKHRYTNRHRKNCCIPRGAPLLILWLATRFLLDSSLCTVRLPGCALFECRCIKKQENQPCSCWYASPASNPARLPASCANICLKTLRWNAFAVECQALWCCQSAEKSWKW